MVTVQTVKRDVIAMIKNLILCLNLFLKLRSSVMVSLFCLSCLFPSLLYAQKDAATQGNNPEQDDDQGEPSGFVKEFLRVNRETSEDLGKAADILDRNISPATPGHVEKNKTNMYFVVGGDFDDRGHIVSNFRYGAQLHLPRFEKYWKVKFANQDDKRERGQSSMTRQQRTRNTNDDIFLGVNFLKRWDHLDVSYQPQLAFHNNLGIDHSIDAETEFKWRKFRFIPKLELFAYHGEGVGSSADMKFKYLLTRSIDLHQGNDARFVYLASEFLMNHSVGFGVTPNDRVSFSLDYFRSFANTQATDFQMSAYGYYVTSAYVIYVNVLSLEVKPYIVYEREYGFEQTNGIVVNFRIIF